MAHYPLPTPEDIFATLASEVNYLGHTLSSQGMQPRADKVKVIQAVEVSQNKQKLSTFVAWCMKYYHRFLPNMIQVMAHLFELEKEGKGKQWRKEHDKAFSSVKKLLLSHTLLVHYDPGRALFLSCDASAYGLGAVLEQY